ncbi:MAG: hypothetical protein ACP5M0_01085 [Desulfomonilaceae bacterium]
MTLVKPISVLVCLLFLAAMSVGESHAWNYREAAFVTHTDQQPQTPQPQQNEIAKVKQKKIVKVKPPQAQVAPQTIEPPVPACMLPIRRVRGWELEGQAFYARIKGTVRFGNALFTPAYGTSQLDVDFNSDLGIPEHQWIGAFTAKYFFKPKWAIRYSVMPTMSEAMASPSRTFNFGPTVSTFGLNTKVKWERLDQRIGLVFDSIRTPSSRVGVFADYVRLTERLRVYQMGGNTFDNDLNLAMVGLELERCLKSTRLFNILSLECKAGFAFGDDSIGSDLSTGLRYTIPLNNGRWGFVKGGYRYLTFKKKYNDLKLFDTAMEGGFLEAGFIF